jgi:anti-anti-sigma factor
MMSIGGVGIEWEGEVVVIVLRGDHDLSSAPDVGRVVNDMAARGAGVIVDLTSTEFIDSRVLGELVWGHRLASDLAGDQHGYVLVAPSEGPVARLLEVVSLASVLPIHPTRSAAARALDVPSRAG